MHLGIICIRNFSEIGSLYVVAACSSVTNTHTFRLCNTRVGMGALINCEKPNILFLKNFAVRPVSIERLF